MFTTLKNVPNTAYFEQMFIIREVNSDMPIYILTEQMSEKIKCPEWDSNPRHPDLMEGARGFESRSGHLIFFRHLFC